MKLTAGTRTSPPRTLLPISLFSALILATTPIIAQSSDSFVFSPSNEVFEATFDDYRGTAETLSAFWQTAWSTHHTDAPFQGVNAGAFTAYTADGVDHSFGIRERDPVDLRDSRLLLQIENQTGQPITGFEVAYDVEAWFIGERRNRIRLKFDIYPDDETAQADADRDAFETDILSTDNPSTEWTPGTTVNGKEAEHRTRVSTTLTLAHLLDGGGDVFPALDHGETAWFRWQFSNTDGDSGSQRSGLAIDNISIQPLFAAPPRSIRINEVMASNGSTLADEDGDFEDWIELYNEGDTDISLLGWGLSDDPDVLSRWLFPEIILAPGDYVLVWASGKDRAQSGHELHANFRISADGEPILLTDPNGALVDVMPPRAIPRDVSHGRLPDQGDAWFFFAEPTPGTENSAVGYTHILEPPAFSHTSGFHLSPFLLHLSHSDPDVQIYYTVDGSIPNPAHTNGATYRFKNQYAMHPGQPNGDFLFQTFHSHHYNAPIAVMDRSEDADRFTHISTTRDFAPPYFPAHPVPKGTVIRALAVQEGGLSLSVPTHTFFVRTNSYTLPVISLVTQADGLFDYDNGIYVAGQEFDVWRAENPEEIDNPWNPGNYFRRGREWEIPTEFQYYATGAHTPVLSQLAGLRIHGGGTRGFPLKSLRLYARSSYGASQFETAFFSERSDLAYRRLILRNSGQDFGSTGMRDMVMQSIVGPMRFDTQAAQPAIHYINGEYWGLINIRERLDKHFLAERYGVDEDSIDLLTRHDEVQEGDAAHYLGMFEYIETHDVSDPTHYEHVRQLMDVENFIDYQIAQIFIRNTDWPGANMDYWRLRTAGFQPDAAPQHDGRWRWLLYDTDYGFGLGGGPDHNTLAFAMAAGNTEWPNPDWGTFLLRELMRNNHFRIAFANRFADALNTLFLPHRTIGVINHFADTLAAEVPAHIQRWNNLPSVEEWQEQVELMRRFANLRPEYVWDHLESTLDIGQRRRLEIVNTTPERGLILVNGMPLDGAQTPGIHGRPTLWQGHYFSGIPITVTAVPEPGYRFSHWEEFDTTAPHLQIFLGQSTSLTAIFEPAPATDLLHYWSFNEETFTPFWSVGGADIDFSIGFEGEIVFGSGQDFAGENSRLGEEAGFHVRLNNPLATRMWIDFPTAGYENIVLSYEARRSNQGPGLHSVSYSLDAEDDHLLSWLPLDADTPHVFTFDLSAHPQLANQSHVSIRITFAQGDGGTAGNVRFDNIVIEGTPTSRTHFTETILIPDIPRATKNDFDGDGKANIAVYRPASGHWYIASPQGGMLAPIQFGAPEDIPVPADYDGDGILDVAVFRPSTSTWHIFGSSAGPFPPITFGAPGDRPIPADYDGDGIADLAVFRPSTSEWIIFGSSAGPFPAITFGAPGDIPIPADYDGDGFADFAVFRPSTATWFIFGSSMGPTEPVVFGAPGDIPVPADYDGDGRADIAVFRPSISTWYIWGSSVGGMDPVIFGGLGDVPIR